MKKALLVLAVAGMFTATSSSAIAAVTKSNATHISGGDDKKCSKKCEGKKCCKGKAEGSTTETKSEKPK